MKLQQRRTSKVVPDQKRKDKPLRMKRNGKTTGNDWKLRSGIMIALALFAGYLLVTQNEEKKIEHLRRQFLHDEYEPLSKEWEEKYAKLEAVNEKLKKDTSDYDLIKTAKEEQYEKEKRNAEAEIQRETERINKLTALTRKMMGNIELMSKTELLEKFGPGPHHVEILVAFFPDFPKIRDSDYNTGRIVIEMAGVEDMPHTVYWFLEQVSHKLYDGCSFHRNAGHVIQGGPAPNFLSPIENTQLEKRFRDAGYFSVLFQEYSPNFPHKKYTLGYAGRPGGPDFYISTEDNSRLHGPGGQTSYADRTEADPCFAKVIEGFDVVDRMQLGPVQPGEYMAMVNNVAIVSMQLMTDV